MNAILGIGVGVLATLLVSRHYYRRSTRKSLRPYLILSSPVFAGIDKEVRQNLHFMFRDKEVVELHHLEFLVANDGERAVSNLLEPLRMRLPAGVEILDASILYRSPESLQASIGMEAGSRGEAVVVFKFPLLNKREYFLVKLLVSGHIPSDALDFTVLADDLPRSIKAEWLPADALQERQVRVEWSAMLVGVFLLGLALATGHVLYTLSRFRPELFPYPWSSFHPSWPSLAVGVNFALAVLLTVLGAVLIVVGFGGVVPRGPRFPLPEGLLRRAGAFPFPPYIHMVEVRTEDPQKHTVEKTRTDLP